MLVPFSKPNSWNELNSELHSLLPIDRKVISLQVYLGMRHALAETLYSFAQHFPQKTKFVYVKDLNPFVEAMAVTAAKAGLEVFGLDIETATSPGPVAETLNPRQDLMVVYPSHDPFTSRSFEFGALRTLLNEKKVTSLRVSHQPLELDWDLGRTEISVHSTDANWALSYSGIRARAAPLVANELNWNANVTEDLLRSCASATYDREKVLAWEAQNVGDSKPFFESNSTRVFDRAVVFWEDMEGSSIIDFLAQELGIKAAPLKLETLSPARWGSVRDMEYLSRQGFSPVRLRGTIMIHHDLIDERLTICLDRVRRKILKLQHG